MGNVYTSILKYKAWLDRQPWIPPTLREAMLANASSAFAQQDKRSQQVKGYLGQLGVPIAFNPGYQGAMGEISAIRGKHSGATAQNMVNATIGKWTAYGLDNATLTNLANAIH